MGGEVIIEGQGLSGLNLASILAQQNRDILLTGQRFDNRRSWFVLGNTMPSEVMEAVNRGTIRSHELTGARFCIFRGERLADDFSTNLSGLIPTNTCLMIDDRDLKEFYYKKATSQGNVQIVNSSVRSAKVLGTGQGITLKNGDKYSAPISIDASGTESNLQRRFEVPLLGDDPIVIWYHGARFKGKFDHKLMVFPLKDTSTGRASYIAPWSEHEADVIACDYCRLSEFEMSRTRMEDTFGEFVSLCTRNGICEIEKETEQIFGKVRVVPIRRPTHSSWVFAVGDAAGQADPNMGEGVSTALNQSNNLARMLEKNPDLKPVEYYRNWRYQKPQFPYDLSMSFLLNRVSHDKAAQHSIIYRTIVEKGSPETQLRLVTERRLRLGDVPVVLKAGAGNKIVFVEAAFHLFRSKFLNVIPAHKRMIYGSV